MEAKRTYMNRVKKSNPDFYLYSASIFLVEQKVKPKKVLLAMNKNCIRITDTSMKKEVLLEFKWPEILHWRAEEGKSFNFAAGSALKPQKPMFFTKRPDIICDIFEEFIEVSNFRPKVLDKDSQQIAPVPPIEPLTSNPAKNRKRSIRFSTAEERIREARGKRGSMAVQADMMSMLSFNSGSLSKSFIRPASVYANFNFEDVYSQALNEVSNSYIGGSGIKSKKQ